MSIPVTLYAVVKSPQLLEGGGAKLFQDYLRAVHSFNTKLGSTVVGGAVGGVNPGGIVDLSRTN